MIDQYISEEIAAGKLRQITSPAEITAVHTSSIGIIPKPHQPGKFRLIVDLSSPQGHSVNDGIHPGLCSLQYASVDQAAAMVNQLGKGAFMAKLDLKSAYRMVPVHPHDQPLLGIEWQGSVYCDLALPFGLRSAPKIFTAVADALAWAMICQGIGNVLHYLDDFFFCAATASAVAEALGIALPLCTSLGLPVAPQKVEGPSTTITFLGIQLDTVEQEIRLPRQKLIRLQGIVDGWTRKKCATKHQLQVLLGHLGHAATVVRPGRTFTRHLIEATKIPKRPFHKVRLNVQCRADIAWWSAFLQGWNGISYLSAKLCHTCIVADASGSWGCGAFEKDSLCWFQIQWPQSWQYVNIAVKEMLPLVVGAAIWGSRWEGHRVSFLSDNLAVVNVLTARSAKDPHIMHLLRCLFFFEAHFKFEHVAQHVPGKMNTAADALSRNRSSEFHSIYPQAQQCPSSIPHPLLTMVLGPTQTWTSPSWREMFLRTLQEVCHRQP